MVHCSNNCGKDAFFICCKNASYCSSYCRSNDFMSHGEKCENKNLILNTYDDQLFIHLCAVVVTTFIKKIDLMIDARRRSNNPICFLFNIKKDDVGKEFPSEVITQSHPAMKNVLQTVGDDTYTITFFFVFLDEERVCTFRPNIKHILKNHSNDSLSILDELKEKRSQELEANILDACLTKDALSRMNDYKKEDFIW